MVAVSTVLALVTFALYWPLRGHEFINYDDNLYVTQNAHVQAGLTTEGVKWAFRIGEEERQTYWHPLTWMSHMLDCQLFHLKPGAHHLINLFFHIANTLALFWMLRQMTRAFWPSAVVAALFAVHPLQVESVAWVAERKNLLSTFFWITTTIAYERYARTLSVVRYLPVVSLFAAGLMAKPMLVTLPCALLLLDFWPLRRTYFSQADSAAPPRQPVSTDYPVRTVPWLLAEKLPLFLLAAVSSAITILEHKRLGLILTSTDLPLGSRCANALVSYVRYMGKVLWPHDLAIYYPYQTGGTKWDAAASALLLAGVTAFALWKRRIQPHWLVGWFWFLGTLVPVIGIVQVNEQAMADRFAYVPIIGLLALTVWGASGLSAHWRYRPAILTALIILAVSVSVFRTSSQIRHWKNSQTLFAHALAVTANNAPAEAGLALALDEKGKWDEALSHLRETLRIKPNSPEVHVLIAQIQTQKRDFAGAIASYREALRFKPEFPEALNNLAWLLATNPDSRLRNGAEAIAAAERACDLTYYRKAVLIGTLAAAYAEAGRFPEAVQFAQQAIQLAASAGDNGLVKRNQELLEGYRKGEPARDSR